MKMLHFCPSLAGWSLASWCSSSSLYLVALGCINIQISCTCFRQPNPYTPIVSKNTHQLSELPSWNECTRTEIRREHLCLFLMEEGVRLKAGQQLHPKKNLFTNLLSLCPLIFSLWIWELPRGVFLYILRKYTFQSDALLWDLYLL